MTTLEKGVKVPAGLVLPRGAMPNWTCEICGTHFYEEVSYVRHVARCAKKHRDQIEQLAEKNRNRDPLHQATDWEALEYQRRRYGHPRQR